MVLNSAQVMFVGAELGVLLLGAYALFEWGLALLKKFGAGWSEKKVQLAFGIPATIVSFLPCAVLSAAVRLQPEGEGAIVKTEDTHLIYAFFFALLLGIVIELVALVVFSVKLGRLKRANSGH